MTLSIRRAWSLVVRLKSPTQWPSVPGWGARTFANRELDAVRKRSVSRTMTHDHSPSLKARFRRTAVPPSGGVTVFTHSRALSHVLSLPSHRASAMAVAVTLISAACADGTPLISGPALTSQSIDAESIAGAIGVGPWGLQCSQPRMRVATADVSPEPSALSCALRWGPSA
jgi:hypothetical protein